LIKVDPAERRGRPHLAKYFLPVRRQLSAGSR